MKVILWEEKFQLVQKVPASESKLLNCRLFLAFLGQQKKAVLQFNCFRSFPTDWRSEAGMVFALFRK